MGKAMVKVNEAEWDKARKLNANGGNRLTEVEKELLGRAIRLEFPIVHVSLLPEIADLFRELADTIDRALESQEGTLRSRLAQIKYEARMFQGIVRDRRAELEKAEREETQKR